MNFCLSVKIKVIKPHKIILTFFVYKYIAPIYIFWKSSPLPQSIVYFISTHTTKSYPKIPQQHSPKITLISQINLTLPPCNPTYHNIYLLTNTI